MGKITALDGAKIADAVYEFDSQVGEYEIAKNNNVQVIYDSQTGLQLALYENSTTGDYVIAVRGTDEPLNGDIATNIRMYLSTISDMLPSTFLEATGVVESLISTYGLSSANTTIVGHSMGGSIAQYLGSSSGFETLTYNAYGVNGGVKFSSFS